jgi:hypothetical protein
MNHTEDVCIDRSTPAQAARMGNEWEAYRG